MANAKILYHRPAVLMLAGAMALGLAACAGDGIGQTSQHGYIVSETALAQIPVGSSRDQVLIALGTPSTTAQFSGEVFYYISQTRRAPARFMQEKVDRPDGRRRLLQQAGKGRQASRSTV